MRCQCTHPLIWVFSLFFLSCSLNLAGITVPDPLNLNDEEDQDIYVLMAPTALLVVQDAINKGTWGGTNGTETGTNGTETGTNTGTETGTNTGTNTGEPIDDHGNTFASATDLGVLLDDAIQSAGALEIGGDTDFFKFQLLNDGNYSIYTESDLDNKGYLYNETEDLVDFSDDRNFPEDRNFGFQRFLNAGIYYIQALGYNSAATGTYTLRIEDGPVDDHSSTFDTSSFVTIAESGATGNIEVPGDEDYFILNIATTGSFKIITEGATNTVGQVFDENQTLLYENDDNQDGENFKIYAEEILNNATYYLMVKHADVNGGTGPYTIKMYALPDDDHPEDSTLADASDTVVKGGDPVAGNIEVPGDVDSFLLNVTGSGDTRIYSRVHLPLKATLYEADGRTELAFLNGGDSNFFLVWPGMDSGNYVLTVEHTDPVEGVGEYEIYLDNTTDDFGDTPATAASLGSVADHELDGELEIPGQPDFFGFTAAHSGAYEIYTEGDTDTYGALYGSDGVTILAFNEDVDYPGNANFRVSVDLVAGEIYYVKVKASPFLPNEVGVYHLVFAYAP